MRRRLMTGSSAIPSLALLLLACTAPAGSAVPGTPSPSPTASPARSPSPSPTPTEAPSVSPSPSVADASWYPWLPAIDTSVEASFHVDTFVTGRVDVVPVSETPGGPPFRFDTGDPDPSTHPLIGFQKDSPLVVLHGPVVVDDAQWYLLTPAQLSVDTPSGWSPAAARDGTPYLAPGAVACPPSPIRPAALEKLMLTDGLPVCYGDREVTIVGDLRCDARSDTFAVGATWLAGGICGFGPPPSVYGLDPGLSAGMYSVTGHFLDPEARGCRSADGDTSPTNRLAAVLHCRRAFVAESAVPA